MTPDEKYEDWRRRVARAAKEIEWLLLSKETFDRLQSLIRTHSQMHRIGPDWSNYWIAANWVIATAVRIRAQVDRDRRSESIRNVLAEMTGEPHILTRERFLTSYREGPSITSGDAARLFDSFSGGGAILDPRLVQADIDRLEQGLAYVKQYTDTRAAHLDRNARIASLRPNDLTLALEILRKTAARYMELFNVCDREAGFGHHRSAAWEEFFLEDWGPEDTST